MTVVLLNARSDTHHTLSPRDYRWGWLWKKIARVLILAALFYAIAMAGTGLVVVGVPFWIALASTGWAPPIRPGPWARGHEAPAQMRPSTAQPTTDRIGPAGHA